MSASFDANVTDSSDGQGSSNNSEGVNSEVFRISKKKLEVQEVYEILKKLDVNRYTRCDLEAQGKNRRADTDLVNRNRQAESSSKS